MLENVTGHALHKKSLQRQIGVGTLVRSQERRAAVRRPANKPVINRLSTGCQQRVFLIHRFTYVGVSSLVLPRGREGQLSTMPRRSKGTVVLWANRPVGVPSYPAPPRRSTVRRPAPTRPLYVQVFGSTGSFRTGV